MARQYSLSIVTRAVYLCAIIVVFSILYSVQADDMPSGEIIRPAFAAKFIVETERQTFAPGDPMTLFGKGFPNDVLVVKLHDPTDRVIKIDLIQTDNHGFFSKQIFVWPRPSTSYVFGLYNLEISSSVGSPDTQTVPVVFAQSSITQGNQTSAGLSQPAHILAVKLNSPGQVSTNSTFRIFVQVTFDGALIDADSSSLLGSSHIHFGNQTILLAGKFNKLHEGLYYADVSLHQDGTYIIHAIAFYQGFLAHDTEVVTASSSSIGTVQESVNLLNARLNDTNNRLDQLQGRLNQTSIALNDTRSSVTASVADARQSIGRDIQSANDTVNSMKEASGQLNSIILPILVLISIIVALQISLFARIKASYR